MRNQLMNVLDQQVFLQMRQYRLNLTWAAIQPKGFCRTKNEQMCGHFALQICEKRFATLSRFQSFDVIRCETVQKGHSIRAGDFDLTPLSLTSNNVTTTLDWAVLQVSDRMTGVSDEAFDTEYDLIRLLKNGDRHPLT